MQVEPLVSIIINNYNYDRFIAEAIDSALSQTYPHIEVIVVDDCSTDNSREIITGYGDRIFPIFHEINGKQGAAFNSGFAKSQGEIIIFLDSDDYLYPHAVERIVAAWKPDIAKIHYRLNVVNIAGENYGYSYPQGNNGLENGEVWRTLLQIGTYIGVPTSGNALSRKALSQVIPIPIEYNTISDDYLSVLIPLYGEVVAIEEPLGAYRIHTSNQWALTEVTAERFHRFVHHDLQRCELLKQQGRKLGYDVPDDLDMRFFGRVWSRLASLRYDPSSHPVPADRRLTLTLCGLRAIWKYSNHNLQKRSIFSLWFIWVGIAPQSLAKPLVVWLFAPHLRPNFIKRILNGLRTLVSQESLRKAKQQSLN